MVKELAEKLPQVKVTPLEGTYLSWLDFNACLKDEELEEIIQNKCKIAVDYGRWFGEAGKGFIRINLATPRKYVEEAVKSLIDVLK